MANWLCAALHRTTKTDARGNENESIRVIRTNQDSLPADSALQVPAEGSTLYYSLLGCDAHQSNNLCALLRLFQTLTNTLIDVQEPTVAEQKIHWWHEEIDRLFNQQARHPDCQRLQQSDGFARLAHGKGTRAGWRPRLLEILAANNNEKFLNAPDEDAFRLRMLSDYGNRIALVLELLDNAQPPTEYQEQLSLGLGLFDRLRQSHRLYHSGYPIWPDSAYQQHNLQPDQLLQPSSREESVALFAYYRDATCRHLDAALSIAASNKASCAAAAVLSVNAGLRRKQLTVWSNKCVNPLEKYVTLTPVNKAWSSWRYRSAYR